MSSEHALARNPLRRDHRLRVIRTIIRGACAAAAILSAQAYAGPTELFRAGDVEGSAPGEPIHVRAGLVQIGLAHGLVLSAGSGARFLVNSSGAELTVFAGQVRVVATETNTLSTLATGHHRLRAPQVAGDADLHGLQRLTDRQGVHLADSALLRQDRLLQVDTNDFVRGLFSLFRR